MKKLLLSLLVLFAALSFSCDNQNTANRNANVTPSPSPTASPGITANGVEPLRDSQHSEESVAVITLSDAAPPPSPAPSPASSPMPCVLTINRPTVKLLTDDAPNESKVQWVIKHRCSAAPNGPVTVKIDFNPTPPKPGDGGPFGDDVCNISLSVDDLPKGRNRRIVSNAAKKLGTYGYSISAYIEREGAPIRKVAPDLDPQIEIGGGLLKYRQ